MEPAAPNRLARQLFDGLPPRYDLLAEVLSFGQNGRWRRAMVGAVAAGSPRRVLDVATGPGGVALQLAARTSAWVAGLDITPEMLHRAAANLANGRQRDRVALVLGRGEQLPFPDASFDALTFTYLLRYVEDPAATVRELARVVRPGGVVASLEFCTPPEPIWLALWALYTSALLPAAGLLLGGREWWDVGRFLGPSISAYYRKYPLDWHARAWEAAGIGGITTRLMSRGGGLVMWGRKAAPSHG